MVECSRVTLPKPLSVIREAQIESRREIHDKIYQKYRKENCRESGKQEPNISDEERRGLKNLKKRIKNEELVIIKTNRDKYLEIGKVHVGDDKKIDRAKIRETDKTLNEHSTSGCSIWGTGRRQCPEQQSE